MSESKSLLSIVDTATSIERLLLESGGELTSEVEAALEITETALPEKIDSYSLILDRFGSIEKFYKEKAEFYSRLSKQFGAAQDRLKDNLKLAMTKLGTDELVGFDVRFKLQNSNPSVVIENDAAIDGKYKITETITKTDKKKLAEDLKAGFPVEGARLERGTSLRTYANGPAKKKAGV